jgi:hypothetical protein
MSFLTNLRLEQESQYNTRISVYAEIFEYIHVITFSNIVANYEFQMLHAKMIP